MGLSGFFQLVTGRIFGDVLNGNKHAGQGSVEQTAIYKTLEADMNAFGGADDAPKDVEADSLVSLEKAREDRDLRVFGYDFSDPKFDWDRFYNNLSASDRKYFDETVGISGQNGPEDELRHSNVVVSMDRI